MKLLILITVFLLSSKLFSQTLVLENNHWSGFIEEAWPIGEYSFHFQKLKGDTLIQNIPYKKLLGTSETAQTHWDYEGAMRENEPGKVYFRPIGSYSEHLIYDFNLQVNDTFTGYYFENEYKMIVDSIAQVTLLNGEHRKQFYFSGITGFYGYENWIEEIGSDNGLTNSGVYFSITDYYPSLNCFTEDGIIKVYTNNFYPCYSIVSSDEGITSQRKSEVFPNPVRSVANVIFLSANSGELTCKIFNVHGSLRKNLHFESNSPITFDRNGLKSGIYFYILSENGVAVTNGKFVVM